jgi:hypothetical protein
MGAPVAPTLPAYIQFAPLCSTRLLNQLARLAPPPSARCDTGLVTTPSLIHQAPSPGHQTSMISTLPVVAIYIAPWLTADEIQTLATLPGWGPNWPLLSATYLHPPRPIMKRRFRGFGRRTPLICARHTNTSPYFALHHAWDYLTITDKESLLATTPVFLAYSRLRRDACLLSIHKLRNPRPKDYTFQPHQVWIFGCALLRFNFHHGDLIRWLGGEYTNGTRNWTNIFHTLDVLRQFPPLPGHPLVDIDRAYRIVTEGAPLAGIFECDYATVALRNQYDNHPPLQQVLTEVKAKLLEEEALTYHILLPRFLWRFIPGLHLSMMTWHVRKGKGRLIVDPSSTIDDYLDDGAPNSQIPDPSLDHSDIIPPVYYATAFQRHLTYIWNLRISHPNEDILQYGDDVTAAFRRTLYHPDIAVVFAQVFMEYLIIPVGGIFGSRFGPAWWCILGELRAHFASYLTTQPPTSPLPLTNRVRLVAPPTERQKAQIVPAVRDSFHQGTCSKNLRATYACFVDDTQMAATRQNIMHVINCSVVSAYLLLGSPMEDRRPACLSETKYREYASYVMDYLGFTIDTRRMCVSWPTSKRLALRNLIDTEWVDQPCRKNPRAIAVLLGIVRNACFLSPLGVYLSIRLQQTLNAAIQQAASLTLSKKKMHFWWQKHCITIGPEALADINLLRGTLDDNPDHPAWQRPICLLVKRDPTCVIYSDAAYEGLGGWCSNPPFMWRLSDLDLSTLGFPIKALRSGQQEPDKDAKGFHINTLEFIALIINIWLVEHLLLQDGERMGGHIIQALSDNTSALSWMSHASRSLNPTASCLARFLTALQVYLPLQAHLTGCHLPGQQNTGADVLSRVHQYPSWGSVIAACSLLEALPAYRLPRKLLLTMHSALSSTQTEDWSAKKMTELWKLEPRILLHGSLATDTRTSLWHRSHRGRGSRR